MSMYSASQLTGSFMAVVSFGKARILAKSPMNGKAAAGHGLPTARAAPARGRENGVPGARRTAARPARIEEAGPD